jgi:hypothetical protein
VAVGAGEGDWLMIIYASKSVYNSLGCNDQGMINSVAYVCQNYIYTR